MAENICGCCVACCGCCCVACCCCCCRVGVCVTGMLVEMLAVAGWRHLPPLERTCAFAFKTPGPLPMS
eukprot:440286-Alexandrium_andersonii.AAC.1